MALNPSLQMRNASRVALDPDRAESRFRVRAAWLLLLAALSFHMGLTWDIQWHGDVGPDTFFTAPHSLMYGGTALAGLVALWTVIVTTIKFKKGDPGVTAANTTSLLGYFRAPKGQILAGFGALGFLLNGGFDLFWHTLYGFDITLFSAPHFGLLFSAIAIMTGAVYAFSSEINRQKARGETGLSASHVGFSFAAAILTGQIGLFLLVGLMDVRYIGPFLAWPLIFSFLGPVVLMMTASFIRKPGAATLTALLFTILRLVHAYWAPFGAAQLASLMNLPFRTDAVIKPIAATVLPAYLLVMGVIIDLGLYLFRKFNLSNTLAVMVTAAVGGVVHFLLDPRWSVWLNQVTRRLREVDYQSIMASDSARWLPTLLLIIPLSALLGHVGWRAGIVLRYNDR
jgi:hypothetical protein